jgi:hypothetical protein
MTPDVSVIVAVHNTETLLPETFASLQKQTLGADRIQVVLVNDGSIDESGRVCDEFAATYPGPINVIHQENSGTPAVPFNRGLDVATGRYVFFLGSDDYLWEEALQRLVQAADRWESDVIFGPVAGVDGHAVARQVYRHGTSKDLDLYTTALPYALANAKMYRRSLIESIGLRYREDMRQRCDQPFTLTAVVKGRRTSLLTDGDYYFARPRQDRSNVTYTADYDESLYSTEIVMDTIAELIEAGPRRDHVMKRQFELSLDRLLDAHFMDAAPEARRRVMERIESLAGRYLTDDLAAQLPAEIRTRLVCAQRGDEAALLEVIDACTSPDPHAAVPIVIEGDDVYLALPPFRTAGWSDDIFWTDLRLLTRVSRTVRAVGASWQGRSGLAIDVHVQIAGLDTDLVSARAETTDTASAPARARRLTSKPFKKRGPTVSVIATQDQSTVRCSVRIDTSKLALRTKFTPRLRLTVGGFEYDLPVEMASCLPIERVGRQWNLRKYVVTVRSDPAGFMIVQRRER